MPPGSKNTMEVELRGRIENLEKNLAEAKRDLASFGDTAEQESTRTTGALNKITDGFQKIFFVVEGAKRLANAVFGPIKKVTELYGEQEAAVNELNSALKNQNEFSEQLSQQYQDVASKQQTLTGIGDEATIKAAALTMRYAEMADVMMILPGLQDFMASTGMKMDGASSLIGKSISSNINALSRYGIEIDTSASKQEKLEQLTEGLAKKFGGAAADRRDTLIGSVEAAEAALGDLGEAIGSRFAPGVKSGSDKIEEMSNQLKRWIEIPASQKLMEEQIEFNALADILTDVNTLQGTRNLAIAELQSKYPSYLKNMDLETTDYEELKNAIKAANDEFEKKIKLQAAEEVLKRSEQKWMAIQAAQFELQVEYNKVKDKELEYDSLAENRRAAMVLQLDAYSISLENAKQHHIDLRKVLLAEGLALDDVKPKIDKHTDALDGMAAGYRELNKELALYEELFLNSDFQDDIDKKFNATKNLVSGVGNALASVVVYGEDLGDAVAGSLKQIAAQVASMTAVWAMMMIISGGSFGVANPLSGFIFSELGFNAKGTRSWPGGRTVVGEEGPEIVDPPAGSRIFNNRETNNILGQGGDMSETNALLGRMVTLLEQPKKLMGTVNIRRQDLEVLIEQIEESKYS